MRLNEMIDADELSYYDVNNDEINSRSRDDTRKPKLMLKDVNKLKKIRAMKKLAALQRQDILTVMYGGGESEDSGNFGF